MTSRNLKIADLEWCRSTPLRCQETLGRLELREDGLFSREAGLTYPRIGDLIFMGYDRRDRNFLRAVAEEERLHQATVKTVDRDFEFLKRSLTIVVPLIRSLRSRGVIRDGTRAVEIGAGSAWVSWMFAEAGCDVWPCELEANSLALGTIYEHERIHERIVCDASLLPFADQSLDLVIAKEIVHHVTDKLALLREANRVLKPGGYILTLDPAMSLQHRIKTLLRKDPHSSHAYGTIHGYTKVLLLAGFSMESRGTVVMRTGGRFRLTRHARERAAAAWACGEPRLERLLTYVAGASFYALARKTEHQPSRERGSIEILPPSAVVVTDADRERYVRFRNEIGDAAARAVARG